MTNIVFNKANRTTSNPPAINPATPGYVSADQMAYVYNTDTLYYGIGDPSNLTNNTALSLKAIGGSGAFVDKSTAQTINGVKTFVSTIVGSISGNAGTATKWLAPMTLSATGDISGSVSFDGSTTPTALALTLPTVNSNVGTYTKITLSAKGLATAGAQASVSDLSAPTADVSWGGYKLTNLANPLNPTDGVNLQTLQNAVAGFEFKSDVTVAIDVNVASLSGLGTYQGYTLQAGDRVLLFSQTNQSQNGIVVANTNAWTRASDSATWADIYLATFFATQGTYANEQFKCTAPSGGTIGTTPITYIVLPNVNDIVAGPGLSKAGNTLSAQTDNITITTSAGNLTLTGKAAAIAGVTFAANTLLMATGTNTFTALPISAYMQSLLTAASASAAQTALGLGTMATQNANAVAITGGSITNLTTFDGNTISQGNFN